MFAWFDPSAPVVLSVSLPWAQGQGHTPATLCALQGPTLRWGFAFLNPGASRVYPRGSCLRKQRGAPSSSWPGDSGGQGCLQGTRPSVQHLLFRWPGSQSPGAALGSARVHKHGRGVHLLPGLRPQPWPRSPSHTPSSQTLPQLPWGPGAATRPSKSGIFQVFPQSLPWLTAAMTPLRTAEPWDP